MTALYYESHVTIEPVFDDRLDRFRELVKIDDFRAADLLMQKRLEDTPERSKYDTFCTGRSSDLNHLREHMISLVKRLQAEGFTVWRYKIEDTLMDSRYDDVLSLLSKKETI